MNLKSILLAAFAFYGVTSAPSTKKQCRIEPVLVPKCHPVFSEVNTLFPVHKDGDEHVFVEISYRRKCELSDSLTNLHEYRIMAIDTHHRYHRRAVILFNAWLHQKGLRHSDRNTNARVTKTIENTDLEFAITSDPDFVDSGFSFPPLNMMTKQFNMAPLQYYLHLKPQEKAFRQSDDLHTVSEHPIVFLLFHSDAAGFTQNCEKKQDPLTQYVYRHTAHKNKYVTDELHQFKPDCHENILRNTVEVLVVNRNSTSNTNTFLEKIIPFLPDGVDIRRITLPENNIDFVNDKYELKYPFDHGSLSRCFNADNDEVWKISTQSPGKMNDCDDMFATMKTENIRDLREAIGVKENSAGSEESSITVCEAVENAGEHDDIELMDPAVDVGDVSSPIRSSEPSTSSAGQKRPLNAEDTAEPDETPRKTMRTETNNNLHETCVKQSEIRSFMTQIVEKLSSVDCSISSLKESFEASLMKPKIADLSAVLRAAELEGKLDRLIAKKEELSLPESFTGPLSKNAMMKYFAPGRAGSAGAPPTVYCIVCHQYSHDDISFRNEETSSSYDTLLTRMRKHLVTITHKKNVEKFHAGIELEVKRKLPVSREGEVMISKTIKRFQHVYGAIKHNIAPNKFSSFLQTFETDGEHFGAKHRGRKSFKKMARMIEKEITMSAVNFLKRQNPYSPPFGLIVDGSTTEDGRHVIMVIVRFVDDFGITVTRPLTVLQMDTSESGENLFNLIKDWFDQNDLSNQFINNLATVTTDSAGNMVGHVTGLNAHVNKYVNSKRMPNKQLENAVVFQRCLAHRLETTLSRAFDMSTKTGNWRKFASEFINALSYFFGSMSHKRKEVLMNYQNVIPGSFLKLKSVMKIRWASSELEAIKSLLVDYPVITDALYQIAAEKKDAGFKSDAKQKAMTFLLIMKNPKFLNFLIFQFEFLTKISKLSKQFQSDKLGAARMKILFEHAKLELNDLEKVETLSTEVSVVLNKAGLHCAGVERNRKPFDVTSRKCTKEVLLGSRAQAESLWLFFTNEPNANIGDDTTKFLFNSEPEKQEEEMKNWAHTIAINLEEAKKQSKTKLNEAIGKHASEESKMELENLSTLTLYEKFKEAEFDYMDRDLRKQLIGNLIKTMEEKMNIAKPIDCFDLFELDKLLIFPLDALSIECRSIVFKFAKPGASVDDLETGFSNLHTKLHNVPAGQLSVFDAVKKNPEFLLSFILANQDHFNAGSMVLRVLSYVKTFTLTSASAERGFSVLNHLYDSRRASSKTETWKTFFLIYCNDMPQLSESFASFLAGQWLKHRHETVDNARGVRGPKDVISEEEKILQKLSGRDDESLATKTFLSSYAFHMAPVDDDDDDDGNSDD